MKKFLALCLAFCLSLNVCSVPSHACEVSTTEEAEDITVEATESTDEIMPRDMTVLWSSNGTWFIDSYSVKVTPAKGTNLKIVIAATDVCKIEVTKNGGWWPSKAVTYPGDSGSQTIDLINNCNGEPYTIKFTNNSGVTIVARIVQTEYV